MARALLSKFGASGMGPRTARMVPVRQRRIVEESNLTAFLHVVVEKTRIMTMTPVRVGIGDGRTYECSSHQ